MTVIGRVKVKIYKARHVSPFVSVTEKETEAGKSIKYKMFSRKFNLADKYKTNRQPRIRLAYSVIHTTCILKCSKVLDSNNSDVRGFIWSS